MIIYPSSGEVALLNRMIKEALFTDEGYRLKLYTNVITLGPATVAGDFVEATFGSYAYASLSRAGFSSASIVSGKAVINYSSPVSWTCSSGTEVVRGYWVIGATSGTLLFCEAFANPFTMVTSSVLSFIPTITMFSEN